jgi:hypothetical protein
VPQQQKTAKENGRMPTYKFYYIHKTHKKINSPLILDFPKIYFGL